MGQVHALGVASALSASSVKVCPRFNIAPSPEKAPTRSLGP